MNNSEYHNLIEHIKSFYPTNFKCDQTMASNWWDHIRDYDADIVKAVIDDYVECNKYPPTLDSLITGYEGKLRKYDADDAAIYVSSNRIRFVIDDSTGTDKDMKNRLSGCLDRFIDELPPKQKAYGIQKLYAMCGCHISELYKNPTLFEKLVGDSESIILGGVI